MKTQFHHMAVRPGIEHLLDTLKDRFDFALWSNSGLPYIHEVLTELWKPHWPALVDIFCGADSAPICENGTARGWFKDVRKICKRHPQYAKEDILCLDDKWDVWSRSYGNLITIRAFFGKPDRWLYSAADYISSIANEPNFRKLEKRGWHNRFPEQFDSYEP